MAGFAFQKNTTFEWSGAEYRIRELPPNDEVVIESTATGLMKIVPRRLLLDEYRDGRVSARLSARCNPTAVPTFSRPLDSLPTHVRTEANRRLRYLKAIAADGPPVFTKTYLGPIVQRAALEMGDESPPSVTSLFRWYSRYRTMREDARALIPRTDRRGPRGAQQQGRVLQLLSDAVAEAFGMSPLATGTNIHSRLATKVNAENQRLLTEDKLVLPSLRTTQRLLRRVEAYDMVVLQQGKGAADRRFRTVKAGPRTSRILERIEIDHTPLDLFIIDDRTWLPLGRPTLTMAIESHSRMPFGYHLSFGDPSAAAVMGALRHGILPKTIATTARPGLDVTHDWPVHGLFLTLVVDNGLEFLGLDLEGVAFDLGFTIQFCPARQPRFKGCVERYLKTINYYFAHQLPGTSFARFHQRGDYDPENQAILTLSEFTQIFEKWLVDVYAETIHRGIGTTPRHRWNQGLAAHTPELPPDLSQLRRRIGKSAERKVRRDGFELNGIRYNNDALNAIVRRYNEGVVVKVVYDPEDLGELEVWGPDADEPVSVQAIDFAYAHRLTERQNEWIRERARKEGNDASDPVALQRAREAIVHEVEQLAISRKLKARRRSAAIRGDSSSKPNASLPQPLVEPPSTVVPSKQQKAVAGSPPDAPSMPPLLASFELRKPNGGRDVG